MQVNQNMYDAELRPYYRTQRIMAYLGSRDWGVNLLNLAAGTFKGNRIKGLQNEEKFLASSSTPGHQIRVRIYRPEGATGKLPAMLYIHGGGYMLGLPENAPEFYQDILQKRDMAIIAPDYRRSQKHPYPAGFNDCYDTLLWMKAQAEALNILPEKFVIAGHSAGGGMTAALTLKARDTKDASIAFQMPIYPMIDHRQITESSKMMGAPVWDARNNRFAWNHYLKGIQGQEIPAYASAALNTDYTDFPPTISFVGDLEPFRDETVAYMEALQQAGVPTKFREFKGAFHGFEVMATNTKLATEANQFQLAAFAEFFDRYVQPVVPQHQ